MSVRGVPEKDPTFPSNPEFPSKIVTEDLVSYWTMDSKDLVGSVPNATVKDIWGNNNGTTSGTITTGATGKINEALEFDGVDDWVDCGSNSSMNIDASSFTFSVWLYVKGTSEGFFIGKGGAGNTDEYLHIGSNYNGNDDLDLHFWADDLRVGGAIPAYDEWFHATFRFDVDNLEQSIWVNGDKVGSRTADADLTNTDGYRLVLGRDDPETRYWNGNLDELMFFDRALTESEIRRNYLATRNKLGRGFPAQPIFP